MNMNTVREAILARIYQASFPAEDVARWEQILVNVPDELLQDIADFLESAPDSIAFLNDNLKKKAEALEKGDEKLLDDVMADQRQYLQSLAPNLNVDN